MLCSDSGDSDSIQKTVEYGSVYTFDVPPAREGYDFLGWGYSEDDLLTSEEGRGLSVWNTAEDTTLKAIWKVKKYEIQIDTDGSIKWLQEADDLSDTKVLIPFGTSFQNADSLQTFLKSLNLRTGYRLTRLFVDGQELIEWMSVPDLGFNEKVVKITLDYEKEKYDLHFIDLLDPSYEDSKSVKYGELLGLPRWTRAGYVFSGWVVADVESNSCYSGTPFAIGEEFPDGAMPDLSEGFEGDCPITLVAGWLAEEYVIEFVSYGDTEVSACTIKYRESPAFEVPSKRGYRFIGWCFDTTGSNGYGKRYTDESGQAQFLWDIASDSTLYAQWTPMEYHIKFETGGGTIQGAYVNTYTVVSGTIALPSSVVLAGHAFVGWYTEPNSRGSKITQIQSGTVGDLTVYARYKKYYTVTYTGVPDKKPITQTVLEGSYFKVETVTIVGYTAAWSCVDFANGPECGNSYMMPSKNITITFKQWVAHKFTIKLYNPSGSSYRTHEVTYGEKYTLPKGYTDGGSRIFIGWFKLEGHDPSQTLPKQRRFTYASGESLDIWNDDCAIDLIAECRDDLQFLGEQSRSTQLKITDSGTFNQPYDVVNI